MLDGRKFGMTRTSMKDIRGDSGKPKIKEDLRCREIIRTDTQLQRDSWMIPEIRERYRRLWRKEGEEIFYKGNLFLRKPSSIQETNGFFHH
jgi:hypothetical protein